MKVPLVLHKQEKPLERLLQRQFIFRMREFEQMDSFVASGMRNETL
jgi:hypothetical protein